MARSHDLVVRQSTHNQLVASLNPNWRDHFSFGSKHAYYRTKMRLGTVSCTVILYMRVKVIFVDGRHIKFSFTIRYEMKACQTDDEKTNKLVSLLSIGLTQYCWNDELASYFSLRIICFLNVTSSSVKHLNLKITNSWKSRFLCLSKCRIISQHILICPEKRSSSFL